jgi:hypothetical protein
LPCIAVSMISKYNIFISLGLNIKIGQGKVMESRDSGEKYFSKRNLILLTAILIEPIIINAAKSEVPSLKTNVLSNNEKNAHYSVQTNITAPQGAVYKRWESLPLVVEIRNNGRIPVPFQKINHKITFKITDKNGKSIGKDELGSMSNHISPWEYAEGDLLPGQTISDTFFLERMLFKPKGPLPSVINIQFVLPIQEYVAKYSDPITIELKDSPFEHLLTSADLPEQWTDDMDILYDLAGGLVFRYYAIHIDGKGQLTTIGLNQHYQYSPIKNGRHESTIEPNKLDELVRRLREFKIEKLNEFDTDKVGPDMVYTSITIAKGGKVFYGRFGPNEPDADLARIIMNVITDGQYPPALPPRREN